MNLRLSLLASFVGLIAASTAHANVVTYAGSTAAGSTYDRLDVNAVTGALSGVSQTGTAVRYNAYNFSVASSGTYSFTTAGAFDTFSFLYAGGFNPNAPATNAVTGNDDLTGGIGTSGFSASLVTNVVYSFVTTSFLNGQGGYFSNAINGDGTILPLSVPVAVTPDPKVRTYAGTTVGAPAYNRVDEQGSLSSDGTAVGYSTFSFVVGAVGSYAFISNGGYDTFLSLYAGTFDPTNPLANLVGDNDDAYNGADYVRHVSAFNEDLSIGTRYTLVTSAFANGQSGVFSNAIVGPGSVAQVPEPGLTILFLSGIGLMSVVSRRRSATR